MKMKFKRGIVAGALACAFAFTTPMLVGCSANDQKVKDLESQVTTLTTEKQDLAEKLNKEDFTAAFGNVKDLASDVYKYNEQDWDYYQEEGYTVKHRAVHISGSGWLDLNGYANFDPFFIDSSTTVELYQPIPQSTVDRFNSLSSSFKSFMGSVSYEENSTTFEEGKYTSFFNQAMETYHNSLVGFVRDTNSTKDKSFLVQNLAVQNQDDDITYEEKVLTFGDNEQTNVDYVDVVSKLFGFDDITAFNEYWAGEYIPSNIVDEEDMSGIYEKVASAYRNGGFLIQGESETDMAYIFPVVIKRYNSPLAVLTYVIIDANGLSIWVNDIDAAIELTSSYISNYVYSKQMLFVELPYKNVELQGGLYTLNWIYSALSNTINKLDKLETNKMYKVVFPESVQVAIFDQIHEEVDCCYFKVMKEDNTYKFNLLLANVMIIQGSLIYENGIYKKIELNLYGTQEYNEQISVGLWKISAQNTLSEENNWYWVESIDNNESWNANEATEAQQQSVAEFVDLQTQMKNESANVLDKYTINITELDFAMFVLKYSLNLD